MSEVVKKMDKKLVGAVIGAGILGLVIGLSVKCRQGEDFLEEDVMMLEEGDDYSPPATAPLSSSDVAYDTVMGMIGPVSTPMNLGSRSGLGGGPLVGSQMKQLGGSVFVGRGMLPGKTISDPWSSGVKDWRAPTYGRNFAPRSRSQPTPAPAPAPAPAPVVVTPPPAPTPAPTPVPAPAPMVVVQPPTAPPPTPTPAPAPAPTASRVGFSYYGYSQPETLDGYIYQPGR